MTYPISDDELLRSYLRGDLPESEADILERRLLVEDDLFDLLESLEGDLLAAVSRGELPAVEREWVLRRLASSPRGQRRLALARSLNALADETQPALAPVVPMRSRIPAPVRSRISRPKLVRYSLATAAGLLLAVGLWFAVQWFHPAPAGPRQQVVHSAPPVRHEKEQGIETRSQIAHPVRPEPQIAENPTKKPPENRERPQPVKAVFALSLAALRGAEERDVFSIAPKTEIVEIQVDLEGIEDHDSFDVVVKEGETTVWSRRTLKPQKLDWTSAALVLDIPVEQLPPGRYEVTVTAGTEELGQKDFEVTREKR